MAIHVSVEFYHQLENDYCGICVNPTCFTVKHGDCEPDCENYHCDKCDKNTVQGIVNLLAEGKLIADLDAGAEPYVDYIKKEKARAKLCF